MNADQVVFYPLVVPIFTSETYTGTCAAPSALTSLAHDLAFLGYPKPLR